MNDFILSFIYAQSPEMQELITEKAIQLHNAQSSGAWADLGEYERDWWRVKVFYSLATKGD